MVNPLASVKKAEYPMLVTLAGMVTDVILEHSWKANHPIFVIPLVMITLLI